MTPYEEKEKLASAILDLIDLKASWVIRQMQPSLLISCQAAIKGMPDTFFCESTRPAYAVADVVKQIKAWKITQALPI